MPHGTRPQLPSFFPQKNNEIIKVENEEHRYEVFQGDNNEPLPKEEYTLDKSPAVEILEVRGTHNGESVVFTQGEDYSLTSFVAERVDRFTFNGSTDTYRLTVEPDINTTVITDADGNTFTEGDDFSIVENSDTGSKNVVDWSIGGGSPNNQTVFTARYDVTKENSHISWHDAGRSPDPGTFFSVTYRAPSVLSRYIDSADEELSTVSEDLDNIIQSKFINSAEGDDLDRIGQTFGELGKRRGRDDTRYRIYLKSIVQSFGSRGTKGNIKRAMSAATEIPIENINIIEDFDNAEYQIEILAETPITGSLVERIAEIADPSGVDLELTRFTLPKDTVSIDDSASRRGNTDAGIDNIGVTDGSFVNKDTANAGTDTITVADTQTTKLNNNLVSEGVQTSDSSSVSQTIIGWNTGDWNEMNWATEHN